MRIKNDFVTNSSSSSFVVAFEKPVKSLDEIKDKIMFIEKAKAVFVDIQKQKPLRIIKNCPPCLKKITGEIASGFFEGYEWDSPKLNNLKRGDFKTEKEYFATQGKIYDELSEKNRQKAEKIATNFIKENKGKVAYIFSYSDNDGEFESEMEHGDTFRNFPHITISHH